MSKYLLASLGCIGGGMGFFYYNEGNKVSNTYLKNMPSQVFIYKENYGSYSQIGSIVEAVKKDMKDATEFKDSISVAGLYFDDPSNVRESDQRAAVGALVDRSKMEAAKNFVKHHPEYKLRATEEMPALVSESVSRSSFSYSYVMRKAYNNLFNKAHNQRLKVSSDNSGYMELYQMGSDAVKAYLPYGDAASDLFHDLAPKLR